MQCLKYMPKLNQKGIIHLLLPIILILGLIVGVYLVTSGNPLKLFSKASMSKPTGPETSFTLVGPNECAGLGCLFPQPQEQFEVKLYARSDIETANLFKADITFPKDLVEVTEIKEEGFIKNYEHVQTPPQGSIKVYLNYVDKKTAAIAGLQRVSKPGLRVYVGRQEIPRVYGGLGIAILSTPKGVMTGQQAWRQRLGGELLCYVW